MVAFVENTEAYADSPPRARGQDRRRIFGDSLRRQSNETIEPRVISYTGHARLGSCSKDPIGFEGSEWNLFAYGEHALLSGSDPFGLAWYDSIPIVGTISCLFGNPPGTSIGDYDDILINGLFVSEEQCCGSPTERDLAILQCQQAVDQQLRKHLIDFLAPYALHLAGDAVGVIGGFFFPPLGWIVSGVGAVDGVVAGGCAINKAVEMKETADRVKRNLCRC